MSSVRVAGLATFLVGLAVLTGCSSEPQGQPSESSTSPVASAAAAKKEEAPKPPSLFTSGQCFSRLQGQAQLWSADAMPIHMESTVTPEFNGQEGKSPSWSGMFASASRGAIRTFTCSADGISGSLETAYTPDAVPFAPFLLKTSSDKAYEVAQSHGGEALIKKSPKQPVIYLLDMARGQSVPYWYVVYGENMKNRQGMGVINATTGALIRAGK